MKDQWRADRDDVVLELADGRGVRIESATLAVHPDDAKDIHGGSVPSRGCKGRARSSSGTTTTSCSARASRHALLHATQNYGALPEAPPDAPTFLQQDLQPEFLILPDRQLLLVLSRSSLDPKVAKDLISRVETAATLTWTAELGGPCQSAEAIDGALVITTSNPTERARAIDLATGKVLWRFGF